MNHLLTIIVTVGLLTACQTPNEGVMIMMKTSKGDMKIKLYDETPLHRDNFVKLTEQGFYDSLLFHRVISDFMIQTGDPESKGAAPDAMLGNGGPGYTVDAEIHYPMLFHKKGALAAARTSDNVNPEKKSSGSQFYIVQGKTYNDEDFQNIEKRQEGMKRQQIFYKIIEEYRDTLQSLQQQGNQTAMMDMQVKIDGMVEERMTKEPKASIADELKEVYRTVGGVPHLDNSYTVFGEVIEGLEVIDAIAAVEKNAQDRPLEDVFILEMKVLK